MPLLDLKGNWILRNGCKATVLCYSEDKAFWFGTIESATIEIKEDHAQITSVVDIPSYWNVEGKSFDKAFDIQNRDRKRELTGAS